MVIAVFILPYPMISPVTAVTTVTSGKGNPSVLAGLSASSVLYLHLHVYHGQSTIAVLNGT